MEYITKDMALIIIVSEDGVPEIKYCPNCGAKLEVAR